MSKSLSDITSRYADAADDHEKREQRRRRRTTKPLPSTRTARVHTREESVPRQAGVKSKTRPQETVAEYSYYIRDQHGHWSVAAANNVHDRIEAGVYEIGTDPWGGWFLEAKPVSTDEIVDLPNPSAVEAMRLAGSFIRGEFDQSLSSIGMMKKMAMLFWGKPGTSKSVTIYRVAQEAIDNDWIVINVPKNVGLVRAVLEGIRMVEPDRGVVAVWEEFDEIVGSYKEADMLQVLDGPHSVPNVMHIMTTNYINRIPARVLGRTRRISHQVEFHYPGDDERHAYFEAKLPKLMRSAHAIDIGKWVKATDGMSIDHCSQVIVGVVAYQQEFNSVIADLKRRMELSGDDSPDRRREDSPEMGVAEPSRLRG